MYAWLVASLFTLSGFLFDFSSIESCCVHSAGGDLKRIAHYVCCVSVCVSVCLSVCLCVPVTSSVVFIVHLTCYHRAQLGRIRLSDPDQD